MFFCRKKNTHTEMADMQFQSIHEAIGEVASMNLPDKEWAKGTCLRTEDDVAIADKTEAVEARRRELVYTLPWQKSSVHQFNWRRGKGEDEERRHTVQRWLRGTLSGQ